MNGPGPPRILSELFLLILQLYEQIWRYLEVAQNFYFELAQGDRNSRMESCPWLRLLLALGTLATQYLAHNLDTEHLVKLLGETHRTQHLIWHTLLCTSICYTLQLLDTDSFSVENSFQALIHHIIRGMPRQTPFALESNPCAK